MIEITKSGNSILISEGNLKATVIPSSMVCAHADANSDSVDIKLKASRKTIMSFNYKDMTPTQTSAEGAVDYIASLV